MMLNKSVSAPHFINYNIDNIPNKYINKYKNIRILMIYLYFFGFYICSQERKMSVWEVVFLVKVIHLFSY